MTDLTDVVTALGSIRTKFGRLPRSERRRWLRIARACPIDNAKTLVGYHEILLFACAFPDDAGVLELVGRELRRVRDAATVMTREDRRVHRRVLDDSGIAGTISHCQFSARKATWLADHYPRDVEIAWEDESAGTGLESMLATLIEPMEMNGLDDTTLSTQAWLRLARGKIGSARESDLSWLLRHFARLDLERGVRDKVFDLIELPIRWRLRVNSASRTFARFPRRAISYQPGPLRRAFDTDRIIDEPLAPSRHCNRHRATQLIDTARSVLAVRHRETDPVTHASVDDVTEFDMGDGIDAVLYGHLPGHRTPIETYYGFVVARNRVPVGYGGGWIFCGRCEIGVNVFDTFRGGESMNTFAQLLRLYRHRFDIERFTVDPYQVGAGNPEAIKSGALWFYYRFGFRSIDPDTRAAAEREWLRLHNDPAHRSSARVLRRLVEYPLELELKPVSREHLFEPVELGIGLTRWIGERFHGEREHARRWSIARVLRALGNPERSRWPSAEIAAFNDLCLLVAPVSDLARWPEPEKAALLRLMRAKGGRRERHYATLLRRHSRLRSAWKELASRT